MAFVLALILSASAVHAGEVPVIEKVDLQPLAAVARRLFEVTDFLGEPFSAEQKAAFHKAAALTDEKKATEEIQKILDSRVLTFVTVNPEMRVKVEQGLSNPQLVQHGWRAFLIKIHNEAGASTPLNVKSIHAGHVFSGDKDWAPTKNPSPLPSREIWMDLDLYTRHPMRPTLSGLNVDYMLINVHSRDAGQREGRFTMDAGQGTQDLGFRSECDILFNCKPARKIVVNVKDETGAPTTGCFVVTDAQNHVYPTQTKRLAPDFWFHPQVYRRDGEKLRLPDGEYTIQFSRGPESIPEIRKIKVDVDLTELSFQVKRWVDPAKHQWISGDHHIHAAGCKHYTEPTEGVLSTDMARQCHGEDLKIGCNLTWGPCFDFQKQFFTGKDDATSAWPYLMHYDVEVSGFGSQESGHLCLLGLKEQIYPGGDSKHHWPTLGLSTLKWAKKQGAVTGPAHSGFGLVVDNVPLPNYEIPAMDSIGAMETIVDLTHDVPGPDDKLIPAIDFISTCDTPAIAELNFWYHTLNAGYRLRAAGETDFPCVYGEKVGMGRSYVRTEGKFTYEDWIRGLQAGRSYVSDGLSHFLRFKVNGLSVGEVQADQPPSELRLPQKGEVTIAAKVAAMLPETVPPKSVGDYLPPSKPPGMWPHWHLERARIDKSREVPVEVVVNGEVVEKRNIIADGTERELEFKVVLERSSWVAVRILPSSHTNPVFVIIGDKPIRAKQSIEWCLKVVDKCWAQKERTYKQEEKEDAKSAYDHARKMYSARLAEAEL